MGKDTLNYSYFVHFTFDQCFSKNCGDMEDQGGIQVRFLVVDKNKWHLQFSLQFAKCSISAIMGNLQAFVQIFPQLDHQTSPLTVLSSFLNL